MDENNEIWDEFKWEEFMREQDKKVDRLMELFLRYQDDPNCEQIIEQEMGWDSLRDADEEGSDVTDFDYEEEMEDELDEGDEWKAVAGYEGSHRLHSHHLIPAFQSAYAFALRAHRFVESLPMQNRSDSSVVEFVSNAMIAPAKLAGGSGMGYDLEQLGGNIACCKRGLAASNLALDALREMKKKGLVGEDDYRSLMRDAFEVRNAIASHILDLRERFHRGG